MWIWWNYSTITYGDREEDDIDREDDGPRSLCEQANQAGGSGHLEQVAIPQHVYAVVT